MFSMLLGLFVIEYSHNKYMCSNTFENKFEIVDCGLSDDTAWCKLYDAVNNCSAVVYTTHDLSRYSKIQMHGAMLCVNIDLGVSKVGRLACLNM